MKLYSELQITQALLHHNISDSETFKVISFMEPIDIPSDEDIESGMNQRLFLSDKNAHFNSGAKAGFKLGAKWMKEQIIGLETNNIEAV
jgi:hypothetical protein